MIYRSLESAIPPHLQCPRTRQRRVSDDYQPPFPSTVARYDPSVTQVVMAYFGVQYCSDRMPLPVARALKMLAAAFASDRGARHWDRAQYVDEAGFTNMISVGYWDAPSDLDRKSVV